MSLRITTGSWVRRSMPSLSTFIWRITTYPTRPDDSLAAVVAPGPGRKGGRSERPNRRPAVPLSCGIVGLPNVGKSTIFNALTRSAHALAANYPFATIEPNVGEVAVPDPRLPVLAQLVNAKRIVPATVRFVDIAGLVRGASTGEGLGNAFLSHIRETDAIAMVLRCFENDDVTHVEGHPDPARDWEIVAIELALADLATMRKRIAKLERDVRGQSNLRPYLE